MIKAVLDNNVIISGFFWQNAPHQILKKMIAGEFLNYTSFAIIEELRMTLINKFKMPLSKAEKLTNTIVINSEIGEPTEKLFLVKTDLSDNKIIECAVAGDTNFVVSGDKHLLNIQKYKDIKIVLPKTFLNFLCTT